MGQAWQFLPEVSVFLAVAAAGLLLHARLSHALRPALCPAHGTMVWAMLGMFAGLAIDASRGQLILLTSLCGSGLPLVDLVRWHIALLPTGNAGLLLGGVLPVAWQAAPGKRAQASWRCVAPTLLCLAFMLVGMDVGMPLLIRGVYAAGRPVAPSSVIGAMQAGMALGAAAALLVLRAASARRAARPV